MVLQLLFSPLKSFASKDEILLETNDKNGHIMRMLKPMIVTLNCLSCHANQQEDDVIEGNGLKTTPAHFMIVITILSTN